MKSLAACAWRISRSRALPLVSCRLAVAGSTHFSVTPLVATRNFHVSIPVHAKNKKNNKGKGDDDDGDGGAAVKLPEAKDLEKSMDKKIERLVEEFSKIRAGKASADMFNNIYVDNGGSKVKLAEVGQITMKSPTKLSISVFDPALATAVANSIRDAGLGINPSIEGSNNVVANIPKPSKESRDAYVKVASKAAEKYKLEVRNVRKDGMDTIKKAKGNVSEDTTRRLTKEVSTYYHSSLPSLPSLLTTRLIP